MSSSYWMLFPAQQTPVGVVPAHLFTVHTDTERFDALAEGATDVTGNPLCEPRWHEARTDAWSETDDADDQHAFH